jgi:hypothetical protein
VGSSPRAVVALAPPVESRIVQRVTERADEWFPGVGGRPLVTLRRLAERPRAVLYAVDVGEGTGRRPLVLAKVRRGWSDAAEQAGARPRLAPDLLPASEQTAIEFAGLTAIHRMFGDGDPDFGAVRPLDHLTADDIILMEYVDAPTLRAVLARSHRLSSQRRRPPHHRGEDAWRRAGTWLRSFQERMPGDGLPARQASRDDVVDRFDAFGSFLTGRLGARAAGDAARVGARLAADVLPERLSLAVGHGDYAPRNVFLSGDGRLTVFDPLFRWRVPRHEDLSRFLVAARLQAVQVHTRGLAYGAAGLDRRERAVIEGYCDDSDDGPAVQLAELRCLQLLITLDRWSALVDSPSRGWHARVRKASLHRASDCFRDETRRLLRLVESDPG